MLILLINEGGRRIDIDANLNGWNALYQPFLRKSFQTSIDDGLVQVGFSLEMLSPYTYIGKA